MPMFEYTCEECDAEYEELVRRDTPDDEIECPECGEYRSHRKLSTFATGGSSYGGYSSSASSSSCGGGSGFT